MKTPNFKLGALVGVVWYPEAVFEIVCLRKTEFRGRCVGAIVRCIWSVSESVEPKRGDVFHVALESLVQPNPMVLLALASE